MDETKLIKTTDIYVTKDNIRLNIELEEIEELAESIKLNGLINPITCYVSNNRMTLIAGHRRLKAYELLKIDKIPVIIKDISDEKAFAMRYLENADRKDVNIVEEAHYLYQMWTKFQISKSELSKMINRSESYVNERIDIISYPPELAKAIAQNLISFSVAREIGRSKDARTVKTMLDYATEYGTTPETARRWRQELDKSYQEVDANNYDADNVSRETHEIPNAPTVRCDNCTEVVLLNNTVLLRLCGDCLEHFTA